MDKKKLIGTIIGVACFAALIAGATFAWLTLTATVTNGTYSGNSLNFTFTYNQGTNITSVKMLNSTPVRSTDNFTTAQGYVVLTATKPAGTAMTNSFKITLHKTTNQITDGTVLKFAVCKGTATNCGSGSSSSIPSTTDTNWVALGSVSADTTEQVLYTDTSSFNTLNTSAVTVTYYVYMWVDGTLVTSSNQDNVMGKTFSGWIYASATQSDTDGN